MIISNSVNVSVEIVLSGAITTSQLQVTAEWVDLPSADFASGYKATTTNSATPVELVPAIETNKRREVRAISVYNSDTAAATVTIRYNISGSIVTIFKVTLGIGYSAYYTGTQWQVLNASGALVSSVVASTTVPDGDYTDIVVSGSGLIYTLKTTISKAITGTWSFLSGRLNLYNGAGTFYGQFVNAFTVNRTITFPDKNFTVAGTDDLVPQGAWTDYSATSTIVGWSSFTTKVISYLTVTPKTHFVRVNLSGTSDSTTTTITLPFTLNMNIVKVVRVVNNGTAAVFGQVVGVSGSNLLTFTRDSIGTAFQASGTKTIAGFSFIAEST